MAVKVGLKRIELWNESLEDQVAAYEQENQEPGQIVFYGPSYFTRWSKRYDETPMNEVLKGKSGKSCVVNRGFGSSSSEHQLYYYPRMVRPLAPSALVYECFANAGGFGYSIEERWELAQRVLAYARTDFPDIHIYLCSAHPKKVMTPENIAECEKYNSWLRQYCEETPNCHFIDVFGYEAFVGEDIFVADGTHFNHRGYELYAELMRDALKEELERF